MADRIARRAAETIEDGRGQAVDHFHRTSNGEDGGKAGERWRAKADATEGAGGRGGVVVPTSGGPTSEWEHRLLKAREKHNLHRRETQRVVLQEWNALCDSVNALLRRSVDGDPHGAA